MFYVWHILNLVVLAPSPGFGLLIGLNGLNLNWPEYSLITIKAELILSYIFIYFIQIYRMHLGNN